MNQRPSLLVVAAVLIVLVAVLAGASVVAAQLSQGPEQPIAFPHDLHANALQLDCTFCHRNVEKGANASVPAVQQCMFCHSVVTGSAGRQEQEIAKLRDAFQNEQPIDWIRVHRLPDHVRFIHEAHIRALSAQYGPDVRNVCAVCHGDVASTNGRDRRVTQVRPLKMGDCVSCHRQNNAPTDCTTCHK